MKKLLALLTLMPTLCFGQWVQIGNDINGEAPGDGIGTLSLSADGSVVAIGSNLNQGNGSGAGHVRVFENIDGVWVQIGSDIDGDYGDQTGQYVSLSPDGSTVAVGEPISAINGSAAGQVRVFRNVNNVWTQLGSSINGESFSWQTGAVSLSQDGSILAVGSRGADVAGIGPFTGKVRIYEYQSGNWVQIGNDLNGLGIDDYFGRSVSLSSDGSVVAVGALGDIFNGEVGYLSVFENNSGQWTQIGSTINGTTPFGEFGFHICLSADGSVVASGERGYSSATGLALVFGNENGVWTQIGDTLVGQAMGDNFGTSLALSASGNRIAVGGFGNDNFGLESGNTIIFENQSGNWVQIGNTISGELAGDFMGASVGLSADGSKVATSAGGNDDNGENAGQISIFEYLEVSRVADEDSESAFYAYPNPVSDFTTIRGNSEIVSFELFSSVGEIVMHEKSVNDYEFQINMASLPKGTYIYELKTKKANFHQMLVKE